MSTTTPAKKKSTPKGMKYLADLLRMFIRKGETLRIMNKGVTWDELCQKASGENFSYKYEHEFHAVIITDIAKGVNHSIVLEDYQ